ncbi:hypothetical protein D1007_13884 [Hordeum vulgare]|nr:hypothetical protein D1007_13884 [Hordeum vulgare]
MLPDLLLLLHPRPPRPSRNPHLLLPVRPPPPHRPSTSTPTPTRCGCSSAASFNGWADLPATYDDLLGLPYLRITQQSLAAAPLLLLIPVAALSLSRLPPVPLLATVFAAGFATARNLAPALGPGGSSTQRLAALLVDLDARLFSLKDRLLAAADNGDGDRGHPILEPLDRARDALLERAAATDGPAQVSCGDAMLGGVAREVAGYVGGWAKDALRELSFTSSRKKPTKAVTPDDAAAATADAKINSDLLTMSN